MAAVRQAAIMTDDDSKRVTFRFAKNKLTLEAQGPTTGRSKVSMPIELEGKPINIGFNPDYLLDMLKVLPPDARADAGAGRRRPAGAVPLRGGLLVPGDAVDVRTKLTRASPMRLRLGSRSEHERVA